MHLHSLLESRDSLSASNPGIYESKCRILIPQVKWCPVDVALWGLLIAVISFLCWFVYSTRRGGRSTRSNNKLYHRLSIPYPTSGSLEFPRHSGYDYDNKKDSIRSSATLVDPYHVVDKLENSLIAQDTSFKGVPFPTPTLEQNKTVKLASGLGLGIIIDDKSPQPITSSEKSPDEDEKTATPPPERAHVRQEWWDS